MLESRYGTVRGYCFGGILVIITLVGYTLGYRRTTIYQHSKSVTFTNFLDNNIAT